MPQVPARGSILLATMVVLVVLMILVAGAIAFTGKNREAAAGKMRGEQVAACAEAARKHLLSRLRLFNVPVSEIVLDTQIPDGDGLMTLMTGHFGDTVATPTIVELSALTVLGTAARPDDMSGRSVQQATGGQFYGAVVKCRDEAGREAELEFAFRYGL
jgi:hypothetical protein